MKKALLFALCLFAGCTRVQEHPMPTPDPVQVQDTLTTWQALQLAIAMTESEFKADALGTQGDKGVFQIRDIYVAEVNRLSGMQYAPSDAFDVSKSLEMFALMQQYKNPTRDIDKAIYYHNKSNAYKRKVMENLAFVERYESFRELLIEQK